MPDDRGMTHTRLRIPAREKWIAAGLILLALIPIIAGGARIADVAGGVATADNARFLTDPLPIVLHVVGALVYAVIGAFQFLPTLRAQRLRWHMLAGRYLLVPAGVVVATTGLWMTAAYRVPPIDEGALQISRYVVGAAMLAFLVMALVSIGRRDFRAHGAWMIRAYAVAMGAGTQVLTSMPFVLAFGEPDQLARVLQMDAGWVLNAVVAEIVIRRRARARARARQEIPV